MEGETCLSASGGSAALSKATALYSNLKASDRKQGLVHALLALFLALSKLFPSANFLQSKFDIILQDSIGIATFTTS